MIEVSNAVVDPLGRELELTVQVGDKGTDRAVVVHVQNTCSAD